jgi:hypothetical protein
MPWIELTHFLNIYCCCIDPPLAILSHHSFMSRVIRFNPHPPQSVSYVKNPLSRTQCQEPNVKNPMSELKSAYALTLLYGNMGAPVSAVVSGKPSMMFMFWMAWPEAPLTRLSMAEMMMARPGTRSATTLMKQLLLPRT